VLGDTIIEADETIAVTLSNPTGPGVTPTITTETATTTIKNNDLAGLGLIEKRYQQQNLVAKQNLRSN
jgi:hypothetical protein